MIYLPDLEARVCALYNAVNTLFEWICYVLMVVLVAITSVQVFLRYVLKSPFDWAEEVSLLILIWFGMLAVAIAVYRHTHMVIWVAWDRLSPRLQYLVNIGVELLTIAFAVNIALNAQPLIDIVAGQYLPASGLPNTWLYYSLEFGGGLMVFNAIGNILLDHFPTNTPNPEIGGM